MGMNKQYQHEQQRNSLDYRQEFHHGNDINHHQYQVIDIHGDNLIINNIK